jgi:hypothetical protein
MHRSKQKTVNGPVTGRVDQQDSCAGRYQWPVRLALTAGEAQNLKFDAHFQCGKLESGVIQTLPEGIDNNARAAGVVEGKAYRVSLG